MSLSARPPLFVTGPSPPGGPADSNCGPQRYLHCYSMLPAADIIRVVRSPKLRSPALINVETQRDLRLDR